MGDVEAMHNLGVSFQTGRGGGIQDNETAFKWFMKAAEFQQPEAMLAVSHILEDRAENVTARLWLERAAKAGVPDAMANWGVSLKDGRLGVTINKVDAVSWFRKCAVDGHAGCQHNLAVCLEHGIGVAVNLEEASHWSGLAAEAEVGLGKAKRKAGSETLEIVETALMRQCWSLRGKAPHKNSAENTRAAVLIEPRKFHLLEAVVRNVMHFAGEGWNLHIMVGNENAAYVSELFPGWEFGLHVLNVSGFNASSHNAYVRSLPFWEAFEEENTLIFQTDSFMLRPGLESYIQQGWDMIGAPTINPLGLTPSRQRGYNGGFGLRKRSSILKCLKEVSLEETYDYRARHGLGHFGGVEDVYFAHALEILEERGSALRLPPKHVAGNFSVEALYSKEPVGIHGFDKDFLSPRQIRKLFSDASEFWPA